MVRDYRLRPEKMQEITICTQEEGGRLSLEGLGVGMPFTMRTLLGPRTVTEPCDKEVHQQEMYSLFRDTIFGLVAIIDTCRRAQ